MPIHHLGTGLHNPMPHLLMTALSSQTLDFHSLCRGQLLTKRVGESPKFRRIHANPLKAMCSIIYVGTKHQNFNHFQENPHLTTIEPRRR